MRRLDVRAYLERDWSRVADAKADHWVLRKRALGAMEGVRVADELRRQVGLVRPDWPSEAERAADLEAHIALSRRLKHASRGR